MRRAAVYVDTSVIGRMLLGEPDAPAVLRVLGEFEQHVSSRLLRIELRRLGLRHGLIDAADGLLAGISLVPLDEAVLTAAESVRPTNVATLAAIHLATAVRLFLAGTVDTVLTYDSRLAAGAREHGLTVLEPG